MCIRTCKISKKNRHVQMDILKLNCINVKNLSKRKKTHFSLYLCQFCGVHRADNKPNSIKCCDLLIVAKQRNGLSGLLNMAAGYSGYPGYSGYLLPFFIGKMLLIIYNIIKLLYIAQFQKKNTRWVTEVTAVTGDSEG